MKPVGQFIYHNWTCLLVFKKKNPKENNNFLTIAIRFFCDHCELVFYIIYPFANFGAEMLSGEVKSFLPFHIFFSFCVVYGLSTVHLRLLICIDMFFFWCFALSFLLKSFSLQK